LINNKAQGGLIPVAAIPSLKKHYVFSDYCISAYREAYSVVLLSQMPLSEIKTVILDYQSRSSVAMFKLLNQHYLHFNFDFVQGQENFEKQICGTTAGLVIGDRAMKYRMHAEYVYDLAEMWFEHTGLPAVFALWVSTVPVASQIKLAFDSMMQFGMKSVDEAIHYFNPAYDRELMHSYLTENLCYSLDSNRRNSVNLFLSLLNNGDFKTNFSFQ